MIRLYLPFLLALLILATPRELVGLSVPSGLVRLQGVKITVDLEGAAYKLGLNDESMKNRILVLLRRKLPRLRVSDKINLAFFSVSVLLKPSKERRYFGSVVAHAVRRVTIGDTAEDTVAIVWTSSFIIAAPSNKLRNGVREALDELTTEFAADWYRDNPSK